MATAFKILKNSARAGNPILGAGVYSAVLQHGSDWECKVIKIGNSVYDPWLDYVEFMKPLGDNPHLPLVNRLYVDERNEFYVANMERLQKEPYDDDLFDNNPDDAVYDYSDLATAISQTIIGTQTRKEFKAQWSFVETELFPAGFSAFFEVLDLIEDHTDSFTFDDEGETYGSARKLDIHSANIMFRNNCVVITDPWCEVNLDDVSSMEQYIEESYNEDITRAFHLY